MAVTIRGWSIRTSESGMGFKQSTNLLSPALVPGPGNECAASRPQPWTAFCACCPSMLQLPDACLSRLHSCISRHGHQSAAPAAGISCIATLAQLLHPKHESDATCMMELAARTCRVCHAYVSALSRS